MEQRIFREQGGQSLYGTKNEKRDLYRGRTTRIHRASVIFSCTSLQGINLQPKKGPHKKFRGDSAWHTYTTLAMVLNPLSNWETSEFMKQHAENTDHIALIVGKIISS